MDPAVDWIIRTALTLLFGTAAAHKLRDPAAFRATLRDYRVLPAAWAGPGAMMVIAIELGVALAMALPAGRRTGAVLGTVLLLTYAAAIALNLRRGRRDLDCGCAGPAARQPISAGLVTRNLVLAGVALAGILPVGARPLGWVDALTVLGGTAVLAAAYGAAQRLQAQGPAVARLRGAA